MWNLVANIADAFQAKPTRRRIFLQLKSLIFEHFVFVVKFLQTPQSYFNKLPRCPGIGMWFSPSANPFNSLGTRQHSTFFSFIYSFFWVLWHRTSMLVGFGEKRIGPVASLDGLDGTIPAIRQTTFSRRRNMSIVQAKNLPCIKYIHSVSQATTDYS